MRFFELFEDVHVPERWYLGEIYSGESVPRLRSGVPVCGPLRAEFAQVGLALDFCLTSFGVPVVRAELAAVLESVVGRDVQRIPVAIAEHPGFEVVNVLRTVDCMDENRSEFVKFTEYDHRPELAGQCRMVPKLVIDPSRVPADAHCFRLEGWRVALIVSEAVKTVMETAGCLGATFTPVTEVE